MHVLEMKRHYCYVSLVMTLLLAGIADCSVAVAQAPRSGGPAASGPGAEAYFVDLLDGMTVPPKFRSVSVCGTWRLRRPGRTGRIQATTTF